MDGEMKEVRLLWMSPMKNESEVHSACVDVGDSEADGILEVVWTAKSLLWEQGHNPDRRFNDRLDWSVYLIEADGHGLDYKGRLRDLVEGRGHA